MKSIYSISKGFVVSFKNVSEPYLFNELNAIPTTLKLFERGVESAAFFVNNYNDILAYISNQNLVFARHIHPYIFKEKISFSEDDILCYQNMLKSSMQYLDKDCIYTCQCQIASKKQLVYSNRDLTVQSTDFLKREGYLIDSSEATHVISLTILEQHAFLGISAITDNISKQSGGILLRKKADTICRSEWKLEEAFEVFDIHVEGGIRALDLGAAPGGWTHFLISKGCYVDAIDPANLDERIASHPKVTHLKMTATEFERKYLNKKYDIIVNDMKMDSNESIDMTYSLCTQLKEDGICVLTLKLPKKQVTRRLQIANEILGRHFDVVKMKQLYFNRSEVTVFMRGKNNK